MLQTDKHVHLVLTSFVNGDLPLFPVLFADLLRSTLNILNLSCCLRAFIVLTPGDTWHNSMVTALIAAPILNTAIVSHAAIRTLLAPQNLVLEHLDHSWPLLSNTLEGDHLLKA